MLRRTGVCSRRSSQYRESGSLNESAHGAHWLVVEILLHGGLARRVFRRAATGREGHCESAKSRGVESVEPRSVCRAERLATGERRIRGRKPKTIDRTTRHCA